MDVSRHFSIAVFCFLVTACGSSSNSTNDENSSSDSTSLNSLPENDQAIGDANNPSPNDSQDQNLSSTDGGDTNSGDTSGSSNQNENGQSENNQNENSNAETGDSTNVTGSGENGNTNLGNRFCQVVTPSVVYEPYSTPDQGPLSYGRYVPNPSVGFGWLNGKFCDLAESYGIDEIEVLVPYLRRRPDIDGLANNAEWSAGVAASQVNYVTSRNDIDNLLLSPVPDYLDGSGYSRWRAMHDGTNLYLDIFVSSDGGDVIYTDSEQPWHDDSVEIFIDGDNSKDSAYDGINDFQVTLLALQGASQAVVSGSSASGLGIFYRSIIYRGVLRYEVSIKLESAGIEIGSPFGFDVHINEDDNGGERDAKWGWFEKTGNDRSWYDPSVFGTLLLTGCKEKTTCESLQELSP